jgi:hypothetical protein
VAGLELKPRLATEIVDAAFQLYTKHFTTLVSVSAIVYAPLMVVSLLLTGGDQTLVLTRPMTFVGLGVAGWIVGSIVEACVVVAVSDSYIKGSTDVGTVLRRVFARAGAVLFAVLAKWLIIALGLAFGAIVVVIVVTFAGGFAGAFSGASERFAVIFGVLAVTSSMLVGGVIALYYFACYFAVPATIVIENLGVRRGLARSRALSKGMKRKVLAALGTSMSVMFAVQFIISLLMQSLPGPPAIGFALEQAVTVVLLPIVSVIATLLYYDARIVNEGFDIEVMAADLALTEPISSPPTQPAG